MNGSGLQTLEDSTIAQDDALHRTIIRQHGNNHVRVACPGDIPGTPGPLSDKRSHPFRRTIIDGKVVSCLTKARRHVRTHTPKPNKPYLHYSPPYVWSGCISRFDNTF